MFDIARGYLTRAGNLAHSSSASAWAAARQLGSFGRHAPETLGGEVMDRSSELVTTAMRSRELIAALVQAELERALGTLGLVSESELIALRQQVERVERRLDETAALVAATSDHSERK